MVETEALELAAEKFDLLWMPHQVAAFEQWCADPDRLCVYYPTGKGKTKIMLTCMWLAGATEVLVIAPPITHEVWEADGRTLGIKVETMSHAKFRMKDTILSRKKPVIADEFHLFGGHGKQGFMKFDRFAAGVKAPLIIGSATPQYNDADRVYCIAHSLKPHENRGGYPDFLYRHCKTLPNRYGTLPLVTGFHNYASAEDFLASLPYVVYLPDTAPNILVPFDMAYPLPDEFETLNYDRSRHRIMASQMEKRHRKRFLQIVDPDSFEVRPHVMEEIHRGIDASATPVLIYADHSTVAQRLSETLTKQSVHHLYVDGTTSKKKKLEIIEQFKTGKFLVLIGTATLATGTDGVDKMCDTLIIVDDTNDYSLRQQLVGRILPRGLAANYSSKVARQFVYDDSV